MNKDAKLSDCRKYRYALWRTWDAEKSFVMFIGLNPSTADETEDDPTIRRCINYAKDWGYGGLCMVNLFAFRATEPNDMKNAIDPIGPENDEWLKNLSKDAGIIIGAWGNHGSFMNRAKAVINMIPNIKCLKQNFGGEPAHPLYQKKTARPIAMSM
ncbi:DUF1643 domain-containing protein [Endozoicomonas acroporae]|uniref:DUF1643 domain-containing protein n=1 Tax=Endozoicomonas acroporae TaxID=1701104 RepID=UPI000C76430B|nr:DUF1643 domain-containing protein [Endozoicomonas acroporae]